MKRRFLYIFAVILIFCLGASIMLACQPVEDTPIDGGDDGRVKYVLGYDSNGGSGTRPAHARYAEGEVVTLASDTTFTRKNFDFVCWTDGTDNYSAGNDYIMPAKNVVLKAVWEDSTNKFTLRYDANGGDGELPTAQRVYSGTSLKLASADALTREGYEFIGWSDGDNHYEADADFILTSRDVTMRARWRLIDNSRQEYKFVWGIDSYGFTSANTRIDLALKKDVSGDYVHFVATQITYQADATGIMQEVDRSIMGAGMLPETEDGFYTDGRSYHISFANDYVLFQTALPIGNALYLFAFVFEETEACESVLIEDTYTYGVGSKKETIEPHELGFMLNDVYYYTVAVGDYLLAYKFEEDGVSSELIYILYKSEEDLVRLNTSKKQTIFKKQS